MIFGWDRSSGEDKTVILEVINRGDGVMEVLDIKIIEELRPKPTDIVVDYEVLSS